MLQIRKEQIDTFRRQPRLRFERELANYLRRHFPFEAANADLDRWVRSGLEKAAFNGFLTRSEFAQYLALMAILGAGFDEDPQIPWAAAAMFTPDTPSLERRGHVFAEAIKFSDATGGPNCAWLVRAKLRVRKQDMRVLDKGVHPRALSGKIQEVLVRIYPQKAAVIGNRALKQLGDSAVKRAEKRGAKSVGSDSGCSGNRAEDDRSGRKAIRYRKYPKDTLNRGWRPFGFHPHTIDNRSVRL
jgi:hypothetical protein